jgi:hypothetical protein
MRQTVGGSAGLDANNSGRTNDNEVLLLCESERKNLLGVFLGYSFGNECSGLDLGDFIGIKSRLVDGLRRGKVKNSLGFGMCLDSLSDCNLDTEEVFFGAQVELLDMLNTKCRKSPSQAFLGSRRLESIDQTASGFIKRTEPGMFSTSPLCKGYNTMFLPA